MRYVIITGASIENLGAESMTCIAIEYSQKRFPESEIIIASTDKKGMQKKILYKVCKYQFPNAMDCHYRSLTGLILHEMSPDNYDDFYKYILPQTDLILDVSGYAFTTKFGIKTIYGYLNRIFLAKAFSVPIYIFSQSFGPVAYKNNKEKILTEFLLYKLLKYPEVIEVREKKGFSMLSKYTKKNLVYKPDMVLMYNGVINYGLLRKEGYKHKAVDVAKNSIAIIPNQKIIEKTPVGKRYMDILNTIITHLIRVGFNVSIIIHCKLDKDICEQLKNMNEVNINEIDCTEYGGSLYNKIIGKFDFIVASRYHSIVHAYRQGVPALVLGWEEKYNELLSIMEQSKYMVDCRNDITDNSDVIQKLSELTENYRSEKTMILKRLTKLRCEYE
ncbi:MAG: polysaccharide pyruvyl transferase family protein [Oscillospiraceae bacterium]